MLRLKQELRSVDFRASSGMTEFSQPLSAGIHGPGRRVDAHHPASSALHLATGITARRWIVESELNGRNGLCGINNRAVKPPSQATGRRR